MYAKQLIQKIQNKLNTGVLSYFKRSSSSGAVRKRLITFVELEKNSGYNSAYPFDGSMLTTNGETLTIRLSDHPANIKIPSHYNVGGANRITKNNSTSHKKIATELTITIIKSSTFLAPRKTFKRRSTTAKSRLVSCSVNGFSAKSKVKQFVDTAKLMTLINDFHIDNAEDFISAIGKCFPQQVDIDIDLYFGEKKSYYNLVASVYSQDNYKIVEKIRATAATNNIWYYDSTKIKNWLSDSGQLQLLPIIVANSLSSDKDFFRHHKFK